MPFNFNEVFNIVWSIFYSEITLGEYSFTLGGYYFYIAGVVLVIVLIKGFYGYE